MTKPKTLASALTMILALSVFAFAGDMNTPPCVPGDISTPPCTTAQMSTDGPANQEDINTTVATETVVVETVVDAAIGVLLSVR